MISAGMLFGGENRMMARRRPQAGLCPAQTGWCLSRGGDAASADFSRQKRICAYQKERTVSRKAMEQELEKISGTVEDVTYHNE